MIGLDGQVVEEKAPEPDKYKRPRVELFDWLTDLNSGKQYLLDDQNHVDFVPFMINRGMSQNVETVMFANEMNKHCLCTKEMVHDFYFYILSKKKRFGKWAKQDSSNKDELDLLMHHYQINRKRAIEYLALLSPEDVKSLKEQYEVGGKSK